MSLNWQNLVAKGRAKDIGIAWSQEELAQLLVLEARGLNRLEAASMLRSGRVVTRLELEAEAKAKGVEFAPEAPDTVLEKAIERHDKGEKVEPEAPVVGAKKRGRKPKK